MPSGTSHCLHPKRIITEADVVQLRKRGGGNDQRITAALPVRGARPRSLRDKRPCGAPSAKVCCPARQSLSGISHPNRASWLDGYAPRPRADLAGDVVPVVVRLSALAIILLVRRQSIC